MSKTMIILVVFFGVAIFSAAMYVVWKVLKKQDKWFDTEPVFEVSVENPNNKHAFEVKETGTYMVLLGMKKNLKLFRPPLHKVKLSVTRENNQEVRLKTGLSVMKKLDSRSLKETYYVLSEFEADRTGTYYLTLLSRDGFEATDRIIIRPKIEYFN